MLGRFLHWYPGYTAEAALAMPACRFFALLGAVRKLEATADLRMLRVATAVQYPGKSGEEISRLQRDLTSALWLKNQQQTPAVVPGVTPGVSYTDDDIRAEIARRAAVYQENLAAFKSRNS